VKVLVDLDPKDVWKIQEIAETEHITPGEALRRMLAKKREPKRPVMRNTHQYIEALVKAGIPDPVIARRSGQPVEAVRQMRRGLGYPAARFVRSDWPELNHRRTT